MRQHGSTVIAESQTQIRTRSYRNVLQPQPQSLQKIQLRLTIWKSQFHEERPSYYQSPWYLSRGDTNVARGNVIAFQKGEIMEELARQVSYFFENGI